MKTNRLTTWAGTATIALFISIIFLLMMLMLASQVQDFTKAKNLQIVKAAYSSSAEKTVCDDALEKADLGFSQAYRLTQKPKLNAHQRRDLQRKLDILMHDYKFSKAACQMEQAG